MNEPFHTVNFFVAQGALDALLLKADLRLSEIAQRCGFSDQSHFNRVYGVSPGVWQRNRRDS